MRSRRKCNILYFVCGHLFFLLGFVLPASVAARSKSPTVFDRSKTGIMGSNSTRGMDVCPCFSVLCRPV
jgi:hypothetical protein